MRLLATALLCVILASCKAPAPKSEPGVFNPDDGLVHPVPSSVPTPTPSRMPATKPAPKDSDLPKPTGRAKTGGNVTPPRAGVEFCKRHKEFDAC